MNDLVPVLLAGTAGLGHQNHQQDMWLPNLTAAGLRATAVWAPTGASVDERRQCQALAERIGLDPQISDRPDLVGVQGVIACVRGRERVDLLVRARDAGVPVLLDKPTLDSTDQIAAAVEAVPDATVMPTHHFRFHPGVVRALAAVHAAEIGLLRAVAADLVVTGDTTAVHGDLRNLGVYQLDLIRQATGSAEATVQAHCIEGRGGSGESWSMLGQTDRDVVVSLHVSRTSPGTAASVTLVNRLRLVGTHGWILVDLLRPALQVVTAHAAEHVGYGDSSVIRQLRAFRSVIRGETRVAPVSDLLVLSRALDEIAQSAVDGTERSVSW